MQGEKRDAIKKLEKEFGVKEKKKISKSVIVKNWSVENEDFNTSDIDYTVREALLSMTTSPFLRAVLLLFETKETINATFIEMEEHPLSTNEKVGALMKSRSRMSSIKEVGSTHMINTNGLSKFIFDLLREKKAANVHVVNIHHDYIRSFYEVPIRREELIYHLLHNDHDDKVTVIRTVKEDRGLSKNGNTNRSGE